MAGLLNFFEDLSGATTHAQPNPFYGAQYLTPDDHPSIKTPVWVDANGQPITDSSFTELPQKGKQYLANQPFHEPSFWGGLGPTGQAIKSANMQAEQLPGQQSQQLAAQERQLIGTSGANTTADLNRANIFAGQPDSTQNALFATGAMNPAPIGEASQIRANQQAGVYPAIAQANANIMGRTAAQNNPDANQFVAQNAVRTAAVGDPYEEMGREANALTMGGMGTGNYLIPRIDPQTGLISSVPNPSRSIQGTMINNALGGANSMVQGPSGTAYPVKQQPLGVPPAGMIGTPQVQQSQQTAPFTPPQQPEDAANKGITKVGGTDYGVDGDGNTYYMPTGEFVPPENLKDTAIGKAVQHTISMRKAMQSDQRAKQLPHGAASIIGHTATGMVHSLVNPYNMWNRGYNKVIGAISGE
jgi:hypothetical protein